jgi:ketosteroid isomerase-like protein
MVLASLLLATAFDQVVAAERAFAADSPVLGLHGAFLAHLASDAIVFDPTPVPGPPRHKDKPPSKGTLSWGPGWVAVARSGDLGLSSGPAEFRIPGEAEPSYTGWFFSVWEKQADGAWKVRVDIGTACPLTFAAPASVDDALAGAEAPPAKRDRSSLAAAEAKLAADARMGLGAALAARMDGRSRIHREGACPATGEAARALAVKDTRKLDCKPLRIELSGSGDLGYAYGSCKAVGDDPGVETGYVRAWRRLPDGSYALLADVTLNLPEKK